MRINFLMPCYAWGPSGGFRIVYEYANRLAARGHDVAVVHPRRLKFPPPPERLTLRGRARKVRLALLERFFRPSIDWHPIDERVRMLFVPDSGERYIPEGDAIFATAWHTARSVLECSPSRGRKLYLIQHYETWMGPKDLVDETWRFPLQKIVIAKWMVELAAKLGSPDVVYIPNAIDRRIFRRTQPIENRPLRIAMLFSDAAWKGSREGIEALEKVRCRFPDLEVIFFGVGRRRPWIPEWIKYYQDPPQSFLIEEIYNKSRIFLHSSWSEGFPLPPAEAASCGCALVVTDSGGIRDYVENGVTGLVSPPKNPEALAQNLSSLLGNEDRRVLLAHAAEKFISGFDWERNTDHLENLISDLGRNARSSQSASCERHVDLLSPGNSKEPRNR